MFKKKLMPSMVLILVLVLLFSTVVQAKIIIRAASFFPAEHMLVRGAYKFKNIIEEATNEIEVQIFPGGAMGGNEELIEAVSIGAIEMNMIGGITIKTFAPEYYFIDSPFVIKDWDHWMRVWNGKLGQELRDLVIKKGNTIFLGVSYAGLRHFTSNKPIYTPDDVKDIKLRLPNLPTWIACWKEIGAHPIPISIKELYSSLQLKVADASEGDIVQIHAAHLDEVQKYLSLTSHHVQTGSFTINKNFFDNLSKENQKIVLEAAKEAIDWVTAQNIEGETQLLIDLQKKGMTVVIADQKAFFEKAKPAVEKLFRTEWPVTTWEEVLSY